MAGRNLSRYRNTYASIDPLRVDAQKLKRARRILGADSDVDAVNRALASVIANEEMESAIERAFGPTPIFEAR